MDHPPLSGPIGLFNVSHLPRFLRDSGHAGWSGAFLADVVTHPFGTAQHAHREFCVQHGRAPYMRRPLRGPGGWELRQGGSSLFCPGDEQHFEWRGVGACQFLFLRPSRVEEILERPLSRVVFSRCRPEPKGLPMLELLFQALVRDLADGSPAGPLMGDSLICAMVAHLAQGPSPMSRRAAGLSPSQRHRILSYLDDRLAERVNLSELASFAGMSVRHFTRSFQHSFGCSPHQYLLRQRIDRAKALLAQAALPVAAIALDVGFADQSQFTRVFRKQTGVTPSSFRSALRT